ncbi:M15 family metallopeptidase [Streptomyces albus]|nr:MULTISPECIES: M15 family metallopeptidase [Streptomyces]UVN58839.1 M15 family metallopeptidase [Streptomyces albus]
MYQLPLGFRPHLPAGRCFSAAPLLQSPASLGGQGTPGTVRAHRLVRAPRWRQWRNMLVSGLARSGFVALADFGPVIRQDLRYAGRGNFVGTVLDGYHEAACLLTLPAADALSRARQLPARNGFGLRGFDGYRPQRAVGHMRRWARDLSDESAKAAFCPRVNKQDLSGPHCIHCRSGHSRGSTVDLALTGPDGTALDMGTGFGFFDERSRTGHRNISAAARERRHLLHHAMRWAGFRNLPTEWWHCGTSASPTSPVPTPTSTSPPTCPSPPQRSPRERRPATTVRTRAACRKRPAPAAVVLGPGHAADRVAC